MSPCRHALLRTVWKASCSQRIIVASQQGGSDTLLLHYTLWRKRNCDWYIYIKQLSEGVSFVTRKTSKDASLSCRTGLWWMRHWLRKALLAEWLTSYSGRAVRSKSFPVRATVYFVIYLVKTHRVCGMRRSLTMFGWPSFFKKGLGSQPAGTSF